MLAMETALAWYDGAQFCEGNCSWWYFGLGASNVFADYWTHQSIPVIPYSRRRRGLGGSLIDIIENRGCGCGGAQLLVRLTGWWLMPKKQSETRLCNAAAAGLQFS